jgi:hypothetical protein
MEGRLFGADRSARRSHLVPRRAPETAPGFSLPKGIPNCLGAFCRDKGAGELFSDWPSAKILGHEKKPEFLVVRLKSK